MTQSEQNARNRKNGEKMEILIVNKFKKRSDVLYTVHSAGSFGTFDVIVHFLNGTILYITAKMNGYHTQTERTKIKKFMQKLKRKKITNVRIECFYYKSKRKMARKIIKAEDDIENLRKTYKHHLEIF